MREITWTCHVCGDEREDRRISVHRVDRSEEMGLRPAHCQHNIRYCNDRPACHLGAVAMGLLPWKISQERRPA